MTEHDMLLMIQRQREALIRERAALREQVAAVAAERDGLLVENQALINKFLRQETILPDGKLGVPDRAHTVNCPHCKQPLKLVALEGLEP